MSKKLLMIKVFDKYWFGEFKLSPTTFERPVTLDELLYSLKCAYMNKCNEPDDLTQWIMETQYFNHFPLTMFPLDRFDQILNMYTNNTLDFLSQHKTFYLSII